MFQHRRPPRAENELRGALKHLVYETEMFRTPVQYMAMAHRDMFLDNICLEAFARHARVLVQFLWASGDVDDVLAEDYFDTPDAWGMIRGQEFPAALQTVLAAADVEPGKLSYSRLSVAPRAKGWDVRAIYSNLNATLRLFAETATKLDPLTKEELTNAPAFPVSGRTAGAAKERVDMDSAH